MNENPISDTKSRPEKDSPQNSGKTPGHWLLARLGKRVLRPGGAELTRRMVADLAVTSEDDVVEFAPGLGHTAELVLRSDPHSYTGVEADNKAAIQMAAVLTKKEEKNKKKNNEGSKKTKRRLSPGVWSDAPSTLAFPIPAPPLSMAKPC